MPNSISILQFKDFERKNLVNRRNFIFAFGLGVFFRQPSMAASIAEFEITKTEKEWREMRSDLEFHVMREEGTERAWCS